MVPTHFTVTGSGEFPFDMLRYDQAFPADEADSTFINDMGLRTIHIISPRYPTVARWASFGWKVSVDEKP